LIQAQKQRRVGLKLARRSAAEQLKPGDATQAAKFRLAMLPSFGGERRAVPLRDCDRSGNGCRNAGVVGAENTKKTRS